MFAELMVKMRPNYGLFPGNDNHPLWNSPWPRTIQQLTDRIDGCTQRKPRVGWLTHLIWPNGLGFTWFTGGNDLHDSRVPCCRLERCKVCWLSYLWAEGHCANPSFTNPNLLHWLWFGRFSFLGFVVRYDASWSSHKAYTLYWIWFTYLC